MPNLILSIQNGLQAGNDFLITKDEITLGRDQENDILLDEDSISRFHVRFSKRGEDVFIKDLNSKNGTYLNGNELLQEQQVNAGDKVQIGLSIQVQIISSLEEEGSSATVRAVRLPTAAEPAEPAPSATASPSFSLILQSGMQANMIYPLSMDRYTIGRAEDNKILITDNDISNYHALIEVQEDGIWVEDLNSSNGTFVNNQQITSSVWIKSGDSLRFGQSVTAKLQSGPAGGGVRTIPHEAAKPTSAGPGIENLPQSVNLPTWMVIAVLVLIAVIVIAALGLAILSR